MEFTTDLQGGKPRTAPSEPAWKQRLSRNVDKMRKEIDILNGFVSGKLKRRAGMKYAQAVMKKYHTNGDKKEIVKLIFILKNKVSVVTTKLRRYLTQEKSKRQNDMFDKNRKQFYRDIETEAKFAIPTPPSEDDLREFWGIRIFGQADLYNPDAEWIPQWRSEYDGVSEQEWSDLNAHDLANQLGRQLNWKAPGIDLVPNYWLKTLTAAHKPLVNALNECVVRPQLLPQWMVTGRTTLLAKNAQTDKAKNFRPITCLTTSWKTLTGMLATRIERHLENNGILAHEQQGGRGGSYGTKQQLIINKTVLEHAIKYRRNLSITYIDFMKAYDSVPHPWILETLKTYKVSNVITNFLKHAMGMWQIKLILRHDSGMMEVPNIKIQRGIFQGDTLSPLLFIIAINPLSFLLNKSGMGYDMDGVKFSHMIYMDDIKTFSGSIKGNQEMIKIMYNFSNTIGMAFGIDKCKVLNITRGKHTNHEGVTLPNGEVIEEMGEEDVYKYLGVIESTGIKHEKMKEKVLTTFKKRVKSILKTELNSKNIMISMGEYAIPVISYTYGVINWTEAEMPTSTFANS